MDSNFIQKMEVLDTVYNTENEVQKFLDLRTKALHKYYPQKEQEHLNWQIEEHFSEYLEKYDDTQAENNKKLQISNTEIAQALHQIWTENPKNSSIFSVQNNEQLSEVEQDLAILLVGMYISAQWNSNRISKMLQHHKALNSTDLFKENKEYYTQLLQNPDFIHLAETVKKYKQVYDAIKNDFPYKVAISDDYKTSFEWLENFLWTMNYDMRGTLNNQEYAEGSVPKEQKSSWNRFRISNEPLLEEKELEKLSQVTSLYLDFCNSISNDSEIRERLMQEVDIDPRLEKLYFSPLDKNSIIRIDATINDKKGTIYELDDFPRGIGTAYLLDNYKKWTSNIPQQLKENMNEDEVCLFLMHDTASGACQYEHREMARLLQEEENINTAFCTSDEFYNVAEKREDGYYIKGKKLGAVWHHLMVTPEAAEILPELHEKWVSILPNYHMSSNKWVQAILWEKYKNEELDEKYTPLVEDGFFAESIKLTDANQSFTFQWETYNNLQELLNNPQQLNNIVLKVVGAENAEGVTIFSTLTKQQKNQVVTSLQKMLKSWLKTWQTILLQENKLHTVKEVPVYHSADKNIQQFEWNSINRIFLNGNGEFIAGLAQVTKPSKITKDKNGEKQGHGAWHGMTDMVTESI